MVILKIICVCLLKNLMEKLIINLKRNNILIKKFDLKNVFVFYL